MNVGDIVWIKDLRTNNSVWLPNRKEGNQILRIGSIREIGSILLLYTFGSLYYTMDFIPTIYEFYILVLNREYSIFKELYEKYPFDLNYDGPLIDEDRGIGVDIRPNYANSSFIFLVVQESWSKDAVNMLLFMLDNGAIPDEYTWNYILEQILIYKSFGLKYFQDFLYKCVELGCDPFLYIDDQGIKISLIKEYINIHPNFGYNLLTIDWIRGDSRIKDLLSTEIKDNLKKQALDQAYGLLDINYLDYYQVLEILEQSIYNGVSTYKNTKVAIMKMAQEFSKKKIENNF